MENEFITGWVYKKGELARRRLDNFTIGLSAIIALVFCLLGVLPITQFIPSIKGKLGTGVLVLSFFLLAALIYFILRVFFNSLFAIYKKLSGVGEEEIIFTNKKITSTKKTWVLNGDAYRLTGVSFSAKGKLPALTFKGVEEKPGKAASPYSVELPVPKEEVNKAEKIYTYFKDRLQENTPA